MNALLVSIERSIIDHEEFDTAVTRAAFFRFVGRDRAIFTEALGLDTASVDALRYDPVTNSIRAIECETAVQICLTLIIGMTFDRDAHRRVLSQNGFNALERWQRDI